MKYVKRRIGQKYEIANINGSIDGIYTVDEIKGLLSVGERIKGVGYIEGELVVTPTSNLWRHDKVLMSKNKLLSGTYTGIKGFDIEFKEDGRVIALPLESSFLDFVRENAVNGRFVFAIPDIVTDLSTGFLPHWLNYDKSHINIFLDLPRKLKDIQNVAIPSIDGTLVISDIQFNGVVDTVHGTGDTSFVIPRGNGSFTFPVVNLEYRTVGVADIDKLYLPSIKNLGKDSINRYDSSNRLEVHLGKDLKNMYRFLNSKPVPVDEILGSTKLMLTSDIIYLDEDCQLESVDLHSYRMDNKYYDCYIFVVHESMYKKLSRKFKRKDKFGYDLVFTGVLTYKTQDELEDIETNISMYCENHRRYFVRCLTTSDEGKVTKLELVR